MSIKADIQALREFAMLMGIALFSVGVCVILFGFGAFLLVKVHPYTTVLYMGVVAYLAWRLYSHTPQEHFW